MLTVTECKNAKPSERPVKLFDDGGLHLLVLPSGVKSWRLPARAQNHCLRKCATPTESSSSRM
ncbi:Arm DNA-binding domain-containing protein [Aurantiacibacter xanthus]|uniref:Arm DNA-binding domain-containing protein n=1 Tax=Aurantiacibacter xanthus TaxID=1784712 RepID=UPI00319E50EC